MGIRNSMRLFLKHSTLRNYFPCNKMTRLSHSRPVTEAQRFIYQQYMHVLSMLLQNGVFWDVTPCALVRTDVSEELSASFIRVTRIGD
jgi:hypothetical protein